MNETAILERIDWLFDVYYTQKYFVTKVELVFFVVSVIVYIVGLVALLKWVFKHEFDDYEFDDKIFTMTIISIFWFLAVLVVMATIWIFIERLYLIDIAREYYTVKWILNDVK